MKVLKINDNLEVKYEYVVIGTYNAVTGPKYATKVYLGPYPFEQWNEKLDEDEIKARVEEKVTSPRRDYGTQAPRSRKELRRKR